MKDLYSKLATMSDEDKEKYASHPVDFLISEMSTDELQKIVTNGKEFLKTARIIKMASLANMQGNILDPYNEDYKDFDSRSMMKILNTVFYFDESLIEELENVINNRNSDGNNS